MFGLENMDSKLAFYSSKKILFIQIVFINYIYLNTCNP
jgi:hypothetical protein